MNAWTRDGKPIPYPTGQVSPCVLCGEVGGATWDELVLCGKCEGEMVESLREPEPCHCFFTIPVCADKVGHMTRIREDAADTPTARHCADCGETFTPLTDHAIRCRECAASKYLG